MFPKRVAYLEAAVVDTVSLIYRQPCVVLKRCIANTAGHATTRVSKLACITAEHCCCARLGHGVLGLINTIDGDITGMNICYLAKLVCVC
jgi:hypothetical protein